MTEPLALKLEPHPSQVTHLDALPAGTRLAEFEISGLLGVGGFGMVYQAFDHSLQRDVAIKEYMPVSLARRTQGAVVSVHSSANVQTFQDGLKSFMSEARLLAQFDHPSLVKVFRFWEANNTAYMVMPLYRGITLRQARAQMHCAPPEEWLRKLLWSVLGALKLLHSHNTLHRDISPENIFLQDLGPPVLLDLGAARRAIHEGKQQLTATLKFSYAPIEQYGDEPDLRQGPWTDLYALAAVLHGCLTNEAPLPATLRVMRDRLPSFAKVAKRIEEQSGQHYSPGFVSTIERALSIRPAARPKSVNGFARLMDLQTPSGMSKFDWRAELGNVYEASAAPLAANAFTQATTVSLQADALTQPEVAPSSRAGRVARPGSARWAALSLALVLAALLVGIWPSARVAQPMGAASSPEVAAPALAREASSALGDSLPPQASTERLPLPQVAVELPEPAGSRKPEHVKALPAKKPLSFAASTPPAPPAAAPAAHNDAPEEAPRKATPVAEAASVAPSVAPTPATICADKGFFARPMCIFQECKKPEFSALALCVENTRSLRETHERSN